MCPPLTGETFIKVGILDPGVDYTYSVLVWAWIIACYMTLSTMRMLVETMTPSICVIATVSTLLDHRREPRRKSMERVWGAYQSESMFITSLAANAGFLTTFLSNRCRDGWNGTGNEGSSGVWYAFGRQSDISDGYIHYTALNLQNAIVSNGCGISHTFFLPLEFLAGLSVYATSSDLNVPDVLVRRGVCSCVNKSRHVSVCNNVEQTVYYSSRGHSETMHHLVPLFSHYDCKPLTSSFSTYNMHLKLALAAPGCSIQSTWPVNLSSWAIESGTSIATRFIAGSAALLLQIRVKVKDIAEAARALHNLCVGVTNGAPSSSSFPSIVS
ncbi:unnamed protein product [Rhizoctonia solani]|nr:unnamed protein product [Rhizoctonia solani]